MTRHQFDASGFHLHDPQIDETVLTQCVQAYQQMGCWPGEMTITDAGYDAMLDIFAFDGKISRRHPYDAICIGT